MTASAIETVDLVHPNGMRATVMTFGAVVQDLVVPAPGGRRRVVLGFAEPGDYPAHSPHFGAIAGRYANRIGQGRFTLDGRDHQLDLNQMGRHHLHGGAKGFGKSIWSIRALAPDQVTLGLISPTGDMGYPGQVEVEVTYRLTEEPGLSVRITAEVDQPCPINLCHHSYFNLSDAGQSDVRAHLLQILADAYTEVDGELIPTGALPSVIDTPLDFRSARAIAAHDGDGTIQPYDHNFVLTGWDGSLRRAAWLSAPLGDLTMEVWTTEPGLQFYDGHKVGPAVPGHGGVRYGRCAGLCLEPQHFPDSPNHPAFPDTVLRPGQTYAQTTEFRFQAG